MKVTVLEACDGFTILIKDGNDSMVGRYWFPQDEDVMGLTKVFESLGFETDYEEDY